MAPIKAIIWDNDGTLLGSKDPNDASSTAKVILPNVEKVMNSGSILNVVCSGCKTRESELQNFDPEKVILKFKHLMELLPIKAVTFSPAIGGSECYVILKKDPRSAFEIRKAHEDPRYKLFVGQFKKPGIGMLIVIKDLLFQDFEMVIDPTQEMVMIGDTWHDQQAATSVGIPFLEANQIHCFSGNKFSFQDLEKT